MVSILKRKNFSSCMMVSGAARVDIYKMKLFQSKFKQIKNRMGFGGKKHDCF
jgi:hypothetical protein